MRTLKFDDLADLFEHSFWRYFLHAQIIVAGVESGCVGAGSATDVRVQDGEYGFVTGVGARVPFVGWAI